MSLSFTVNQTASLMHIQEDFWGIYERVRSLLDIPSGVEWSATDLYSFLESLELPEEAGSSWHLRDIKFTRDAITVHVGGVMEDYGFEYGLAVVRAYNAFYTLSTYLVRSKTERNFRDARSLRNAVIESLPDSPRSGRTPV